MIEVKGVGRVFERGGHQEPFVALDDVTLAIHDQEFLSLIGPSGCGKTTLLRMIGGLIKPSSGHISIDGKPVKGPGPDRAIVFQNFLLLPWANVLSNVSFGLEARGKRRKEVREIALDAISRVGLTGFEKNFPHELSGGMQQRVGLARALAVSPKILLMDEPFASVDAQTRQILQEDLLRVWRGTKTTIVFVTHSMEEAVYLSDRIAVFSRSPGQIAEVMDVQIPRPREDSVRKTSEFTDLTSHIWEQLRWAVEEDQHIERAASSE